MEKMDVRIECWPIAADNVGLWLISGDHAWEPALPVQAAEDIHDQVEATLWEHGVLNSTKLLHSTSWRPNGSSMAKLLHSTSWRPKGSSMIVTYVAVIEVEGEVIGTFPDALPISLDLAEHVGKPAVHAATEVPIPRDIDVLLHGIRHIKFLMGTDDKVAAEISLPMRRHLEKMEPALAGLYRASA